MTINAMADSSCMKLQFATVVCNGHSSIWPSAERCVVYIAVYGAGLAELIYEHLTLHELHQSIDVVYHLYLGIGHFKIIKHTYFLSKLHVKIEQFLTIG